MPLLQTFGNATSRAWRKYGPNDGGATDFQLISTQLLSSTAASVTFSSIPSTYRHLQVRMTARTSSTNEGDSIVFTLNSDTGTNYAFHQLYGFSSAVSSNAVTASAYGIAATITGSPATANSFGLGVMDILDYSQTTKNKVTRSLSGLNSATYQMVKMASSLWLSTAAVNSLTLRSANGANTLAIGSRFSLYGMK
jgi:hypothetical protein